MPAAVDSACSWADRTGALVRMLNRSSQPFIAADVDARITYANPAFEALVGYTLDELRDRTVHDITPTAWNEARGQALLSVLATGKPARYEKEYRHKEGGLVAVEAIVDLDLDDNDRPRGFLAFITDIRVRRAAERALRESEHRFRELFDQAPFGYHEIGPDGQILAVNQTECEMLGCSRESMIGRPIFDFVVEEDRELSRQAVARKFRGELPLKPIERTYQTADGRRLSVSIEERFHLDEQGRPISIRSTVQDITDRKRTEQALVASEARATALLQEVEAKNRELAFSEGRYRQLTEGSIDAVIVADRRGKITLFNPAAEHIFGFDAAEVVGQDMSMLIPEGVQEGRDVGRTLEMTGLRKDGSTFPLEISLSAVDLGGELQLLGSIRDQTERQRMRAMLGQSEKLASIGLLSAGVAHEINNPLAYVANNLAVLDRDLAGILDMVNTYEQARDRLAAVAPEVTARIAEISEDLDWEYVRDNLPKMLARTREGVQRVANIVSNLRGLARTSPPKMEQVQLPDLVEGALEMVRGRLRRHGVEVSTRHEGPPRVVCVANQISQVVLNLLINAVQAVEQFRPSGGGLIEVRTATLDDHLAVEIRDNGPGIAAEDIPRLFDPFFTTKPVGEGTGLGLSISHGIVSGHGGRIEVESCPGQGTCFRVLLPQKT
ncbi:PAS domain S-box protein [Isosphaeraceae bacterium EP7]